MTSKTLLIKQKAGDLDFALCLMANRTLQHSGWHRFLHVISRMGDGLFWYSLILSLPLLQPDGGLAYAICMTLVGLSNLALYRRLKVRFARPRPYAMYPQIQKGTSVLDEFSFPSGHTLHAVTFTLMLVAFAPWIGILLIPFAVLTASARVILGVHFPSDVAAGAAIGLLHGSLALLLMDALQLI